MCGWRVEWKMFVEYVGVQHTAAEMMGGCTRTSSLMGNHTQLCNSVDCSWYYVSLALLCEINNL